MRALTSGFRSTPEQKARPLPLRTTARTCVFSASASIWRKSAKPIAVLQAFSRSGRFKLTTATCSSSSTVTASEKSSAITDLLGRSDVSEREEHGQANGGSASKVCLLDISSPHRVLSLRERGPFDVRAAWKAPSPAGRGTGCADQMD